MRPTTFAEDLVYLMPLHHVFHKINHLMKPQWPACLPSPFNVLANLARHLTLASNMNAESAYKYGLEALTDSVLQSDAESNFVHVIRRVNLSESDLQTLAQVLCFTGADLQSALMDPERWVDDHAVEMIRVAIKLPDGPASILRVLHLLHLVGEPKSIPLSQKTVSRPKNTGRAYIPNSSDLMITPVEPAVVIPVPRMSEYKATSSRFPEADSEKEKTHPSIARPSPTRESIRLDIQGGGDGIDGMSYLGPLGALLTLFCG